MGELLVEKEGKMKTIHLTSVTLNPKNGVEVDLVKGYEKCLVFYPVENSLAPYLNMQFLDARFRYPVSGVKSIWCWNSDVKFSHEVWIIQFNHPLPPIFKIEPWQILIEGSGVVE